MELDGFNMVRDIALPDSCIRPFYGLNDGSYILSQNCENTLYGGRIILAGAWNAKFAKRNGIYVYDL